MAWIEEITPDRATGALKRQLDQSIERSGRVWNIVQVMSVNPLVLKTSMGLYASIMFGSSPLSRFQRELLATVVSAELNCRY